MKKLYKILLSLGILIISIGGTTNAVLAQEVNSWMAMYLDDKAHVGDVSIPGTHDSAAYKMNGFSFFAEPWAKTQAWTITQQLNEGIRYLDLRVNDDMSMHHGIAWVGENLRYHLKEICRFLDQHPQDFVFVRLKAEQGNSNSYWFNKNFQDIINSENLQRYFAKNVGDNTLVKDVRGKIILINDTNTNLNNLWSLTWRRIPKQDNYNVADEYKKWLLVQQDIVEKNRLFEYGHEISINHLSYTNNLTAIATLAYSLNKRVYQYLRNDFDDAKVDIKHLGIMVMDFPTRELINQIIFRNMTLKTAKEEVKTTVAPSLNSQENQQSAKVALENNTAKVTQQLDKVSTQTAPVNKTKADVTVETKMDTPLPSAPIEVVGVNDAKKSTITGKGDKGYTVILRDGKGQKLATTKVKDDGSFTFDLDYLVNPYMTVVQSHAGQVSDPVLVKEAKLDIPLPLAPIVDIVSDNMVITGKGTPGNNVILRNGKGTYLDQTTVNSDGTFRFDLKQKANPYMTVVQSYAGQISDPTLIVLGSA